MAPPRSLRKVQRDEDVDEEDGETTNLKREDVRVQQRKNTELQQQKGHKSGIKIEFKDLDLPPLNHQQTDELKEGTILSLEELEQQQDSFFSAFNLDQESFSVGSGEQHQSVENETLELDEWERLLLKRGNYSTSSQPVNTEVFDVEELPLISTEEQLAQLKLSQSQDETNRAEREEKVHHLSKQIEQTEDKLKADQEKEEFLTNAKDDLEKFFLLIDEKCIDEKIEAGDPFDPVCNLNEFLEIFLKWQSQYPEMFEEQNIIKELEVLVEKYFKTNTNWKELFITTNEI